MKVLKYSFVGLLLLASALFIILPTQNEEIFGQVTNTTNTTDTERPTADGQNPGFVPDTEDGAAPPPPPSDATKVEDLPKETLAKDPDSDPLSITNRTEILEVLPANSTKIIKFVDEDLKNTTGVGLAPSDVLEKITSEKSNDNKSFLQLASPEDIKQIESVSSSLTNATGGEEEEDEPTANATTEEAEGEETNATTVTGGEEPQGGVETNMTNATGGEEQAQAGQEETNLTKPTGGEEQAQAGQEETNLTNATGGEELAQAGQGEQEEATDGGEQAQAGQGEQEEAITNATNATGTQAPEELLNTTNDTSILNTTDSEDENDSPEND